MKFQEGDKIMVKATSDRGFVVEWISKTMLTIDVNGVRFPVHADQIDFPYFNDFSNKSTPQGNPKKQVTDPLPREKSAPQKQVKDGVWLAFFPVLDRHSFDEDIISHFRIFLFNHTDDSFEVDQSVYYGTQKEMDLKSGIRSLEELYLFDLPFERLNDQPRFKLIFSLSVPDASRCRSVVIEFKPKAKQVFKQAEGVLHDQQASFRYPLFSAYPETAAGDHYQATDQTEVPEHTDGLGINRLAAAGFKIRFQKGK
jgi:hypothetical protein